MMRKLTFVLAALLLMGSAAPFTATAAQAEEVWVDFGTHTGVPLFKRQNTFAVSYSFGLGGNSSQYLKAVSTLKGLRSESMRVDLSMGNGGLGKYFALGSLDDMWHEFSSLDVLLAKLYENGTEPYFSYTYTPHVLQPEGGTWRSAPSSMEGWKQLCYDIAAHYEEKGWPLAAHEIWNEPDLGTTFYTGTWEDFILMYDYGVRGIREANPNATVGGMSIAFVKNIDPNRIRQFLSHVVENELPMDFLSYHNYSTTRYIGETDKVNAILMEYGDAFDTLALHINEFHVSETWDPSNLAKCNSANMACLAMQAITNLVEMPTVTSVNWATWRDEGLGLSMTKLDTGERTAVYHAIKVYNDMPIDRVAMQESRYVKGLASVDEQSAGVVLYTRSVTPMEVTVHLDHLPFDRVDVKVYAIDENHSSICDGSTSDVLESVASMTNVSTQGLTWTGTIGARGILYIRIVPAGAKVTRRAVWSMENNVPIAGETATVIRKEYYFQDRTSKMFSEFDLGTFTAWAGMGDRDTGLSRGAVLLENLPAQLTITPCLYGSMADGAGCFLYAQYVDEAGNTVLTKAWVQGEDVWQPEGMAAQPEAFSLEQAMVLDTPAGFDGTLKLTWGIQNAGQDVTLKLSVDK